MELLIPLPQLKIIICFYKRLLPSNFITQTCSLFIKYVQQTTTKDKSIILIFRNSSEICAHLSSPTLRPVTPARLHLKCSYKVAEHEKTKQVHPGKIPNSIFLMFSSPCTTFWSSKLLCPHFHTCTLTSNSHGSQQHIFLKVPLLFNSKLEFSTKFLTGNVNIHYEVLL